MIVYNEEKFVLSFFFQIESRQRLGPVSLAVRILAALGCCQIEHTTILSQGLFECEKISSKVWCLNINSVYT